jgi:ATP synthase protein I
VVDSPDSKNLPSLNELGKRIDKAKGAALGKQKDSVSAPGAMHVGIELIAGVIAGAFVGYYLDKWLGSSPWFFVGCFFLGIAGSVRNIMRKIRRANESGEEG